MIDQLVLKAFLGSWCIHMVCAKRSSIKDLLKYVQMEDFFVFSLKLGTHITQSAVLDASLYLAAAVVPAAQTQWMKVD